MIDVQVTNTSANNLGDTKVNQVSADFANGASVLTGVAPVVTITEPVISLDIASLYINGSTIRYTYTLTNTGTAP